MTTFAEHLGRFTCQLALSTMPPVVAETRPTSLVKAPPIKLEPGFPDCHRLNGALLLAQPLEIRKPPELHAKPRGLVGAAIASGKV